MPYVFHKQEKKLIEDGDYEVEIEKITPDQTKGGAKKLRFQYRIRSDVEQANKNACVFEDLWESKKNPGQYTPFKIYAIMEAIGGVKEGQEFNDTNDVIAFILGKNIVIRVRTEVSDYNGEKENVVKKYLPSSHKPQTLGAGQERKPEASSPASADVIDTDDLPF